MKLYIANLTHQRQDFQYRLPEDGKIRKQTIEIGEQIQISGDLNTPEIDAIIEQHAIYGLINVTDIDRTKAFAGTCYSVGKPVNMERVRYAILHNQEVLEERGRDLRKEAAVAANNSIEEQTQGGLKALELSVEELPTKDKPDGDINEKIRVTRSEGPGSNTPRPAQRQTRGRKAA